MKIRKPCVRCGHFFAIHSMVIMDRERRELRVPCGHVELTPAFGGLFRYRACDCPGYVAPAPWRLRLANRLLANVRDPYAWASVMIVGLALYLIGIWIGIPLWFAAGVLIGSAFLGRPA